MLRLARKSVGVLPEQIFLLRPDVEDFPTVCTDPPRATRRVKRTLAYNTEYLYQYKGYGCSDH